MTEGLVVRDARAEELPEVSAVMTAAYTEYARPDPVWEEYLREVGDVWHRLEESELIVAERGGRVVGAVTFYTDGSKTEGEGWPDGWAGVRLLGVHPDARGGGVGRALTEECIRRARERGLVVVGLHTTMYMSVAQKMYEKMGFVRVPEYDFHPVPEVHVMGYRFDL